MSSVSLGSTDVEMQGSSEGNHSQKQARPSPGPRHAHKGGWRQAQTLRGPTGPWKGPRDFPTGILCSKGWGMLLGSNCSKKDFSFEAERKCSDYFPMYYRMFE